MITFKQPRQKGFTLIEVLISLIIVVIGVVAVMQLQGVFLNSVSDAEKQAVAYRLAEEKIEQLRSFTGYGSYINTVSNSSESVTPIPNVQYTIDVAVADFMASGASLSAVSAASAAEGYTQVKDVQVTVSWNGRSVELASMIAAVDPNIENLNILGSLGASPPGVVHAPGEAPDVVAIQVGDDKLKETSRPLPEIERKGKSTVVQFDTVTYKNSDTTQVIKDDFVTVNCECSLLSGTSSIRTPYHYKLSSQNGAYSLELKPGKLVSAATATASGTGNQGNQADQFCTRCCAGHHDAISGINYSTEEYPSFTGAGSHSHFYLSATGSRPDVTLSERTGTGNYLEACRFVRVNGLYQLMPDWRMIQLTAMPRDILASTASSSLSTYQEYVVAKVQEAVFDIVSGAFPSAPTSAAYAATASGFGASSATSLGTSLAAASTRAMTSGEATYFLSRAIYLDDMSYDQDWLDLMAGVAASDAWLSSGTWLEFVPFNEVNTTVLTTWKSTSDAVASVTTDWSVIGSDYSRGVVVGSSAVGSTSVAAASKTDNTGLLGNIYPDTGSTNPGGYDNRINNSVTSLSASVAVSNSLCTDTCFVSGVIALSLGAGQDIDNVKGFDLSVRSSQSACNSIYDNLPIDEALNDPTIAELVVETEQIRFQCEMSAASGEVPSFTVSLYDGGNPGALVSSQIVVITGGVGKEIEFAY